MGARNVEEYVPTWCPTSSVNTAGDMYDGAYKMGLGKDFIALVVIVALIIYTGFKGAVILRERKCNQGSLDLSRIA